MLEKHRAEDPLGGGVTDDLETRLHDTGHAGDVVNAVVEDRAEQVVQWGGLDVVDVGEDESGQGEHGDPAEVLRCELQYGPHPGGQVVPDARDHPPLRAEHEAGLCQLQSPICDDKFLEHVSGASLETLGLAEFLFDDVTTLAEDGPCLHLSKPLLQEEIPHQDGV